MLDVLVFSSIWAGAVAGALVLAAARALGIEAVGPAAALAAVGTLVVYGVDRLRDVERDREAHAARSAFVAQHRDGLVALTVIAGGTAATLAWWSGAATVALCAGVLALGLLHRRLKETRGKVAYVTAAWVAITVGLPVAGAAEAPEWLAIAGVALVYAGAIGANLLASNPAQGGVGSGAGSVRSAGAAAAGVLTAGLVAPGLVWVPIAELAAVVLYREDERYGLVVLDGALMLGAGIALLLWQV